MGLGSIIDLIRRDQPCLRCGLLRGEVEGLVREKAELAEKLATKTRVAGEYFDLIESICHDRDRWRDMYRLQSSEHLNAQVMLERSLMKLSEMLGKSVSVLNEYRERDGLPALKSEEALMSCVMSTSTQYRAKLAEADAMAPADIDGEKARDEIAAIEQQKIA